MEAVKVNGIYLRRPFILVSIMLGMFLSAIEGTIVATAMPSIVSDLGGFSLYSWVFSGYLLPTAATVLIFGKLADIYGRKPIFIIGVSVFLLGSTLSGFSTSMYMLIIFRFIQGIGAGALMPMATTIIGDIYNEEERAKVQGYLSAVWGISAIAGPLLGGFFVDVLNWRYIFWMNIPLGLLAMLGIIFFLHENIKKEERSIDYAGAVWLVLGICSLMIILVEGGVAISWDSSLLKVLVLCTIVFLLLFVLQQRRTAEPMMPFSIWQYRMITIANLTSLIIGMILLGVSSYLPTYVQGVMGESATIAGFTLTAMSIGWPIASTITGRLLLSIGYRNTSLLGGLALIVGACFFFTLTSDKGPIWAAIGSFFIGAGMGFSTTSFIVGIQSAVGWEIRGIATATNMFMRSLGSALGVALLGGLLNNHIDSYIQSYGLKDTLNVDAVNQMLGGNKSELLDDHSEVILREALSSGLHIVYMSLLLLAVLSIILIYFMPGKNKE